MATPNERPRIGKVGQTERTDGRMADGRMVDGEPKGRMVADEAIARFRNREIKAKEAFDILPIDKPMAYSFVAEHHYLGKAKFMSMYQYGLFIKGTRHLVGVSTFAPPQGIYALKGWFGIESNSTTEIQELTRLCMLPSLNGSNATSYLLSNSIRMLKPFGVRAVITLADSTRHVGSIYQNCNFKYYGMTAPAEDMYSTEGKNLRGKSSMFHGVYLPRNRKHRYAFILDPTLKVLYGEEPRPMKGDTTHIPECCGGSLIVHDDRYDEWFTCPKCTSAFVQLTQAEAEGILGSHKGDLQYVEGLIREKREKDIMKDWIWG